MILNQRSARNVTPKNKLYGEYSDIGSDMSKICKNVIKNNCNMTTS